MNYFQLFNIDVSFDVDLHQLSQTYQALQKTAHTKIKDDTPNREKAIAAQRITSDI